MKYALLLLPLFVACTYTDSPLDPIPLTYTSVDEHLNRMENAIIDSLFEVGVYQIDGKDTVITDVFIHPETGEPNDSALHLEIDIAMTVVKNYLGEGPAYMQHLNHGNDVYVLNFSMALFQDFGWEVVRYSKDEWGEQLYFPPKVSAEGESLFFNYDEGKANSDSVFIFIQEPYLVMSRGGLYYSLYDLENDTLLINDPSPWHSATGNTLDWVRTNLHEPIKAKLSE